LVVVVDVVMTVVVTAPLALQKPVIWLHPSPTSLSQ